LSLVKPQVIKYGLDLDIDKEITKIIDVNLIGTMRINHAFHDMIRESKGCLLMIASKNGRIPVIGFAPYTASKHAVEGYAKCIRLEVAPYGIRVIVIEPGTIHTPMVTARLLDDYSDVDYSQTKYLRKKIPPIKFEETKDARVSKFANPPSLVANEIYRCLFSSKIKQTHVIVDRPRLKLLWTLISILPQHLADKIVKAMEP